MKTKPIKLRPAVRWFAEQMEIRLRKNDHKGGWENCSNDYLETRLLEEYYEMRLALGPEALFDEIVEEAADVANFAMMIADNSRTKKRGSR